MTVQRETRAANQALSWEGSGETRTVAGYAAVFDSPTQIGSKEYGWVEVVKPGAFTATLKDGRDKLALYSHQVSALLGRESNGTLRLKEDAKGLAVEVDLPDTSVGRDVGVLVQRADLKGMSFGFTVTKQEWDETVTPPKRTIIAADLYEVTITPDPAYDDTEIGLRSLTDAREARKMAAIEARSAKHGSIARRLQLRAAVDLRQRGIVQR